MSTPEFALGCSQPDCTFRVDVSEQVKVAQDHYNLEHPEIDQLEMELLILCPDDGASMIPGEIKPGKIEGIYSCPNCMQVFDLHKNPMEPQ